ncbi:hypothetical protein TrLO_g5597 [Triparma laevis f. longispina]|uniref:Uncharacterized protein n=1 Tax=Triparma laevis f. longispina TaxID=1714387 RepID=A0A9W7AK00_9STRA|nr:hypothetical protein TrLO_g5597 [Triparma laevis f. longispina]
MLWKTASSGKKRVQCLEEVLTKSQALKELNLRHTWIKAMMATALEGRVAMNRPVGTKLVCVSDAEATQIGRNLIPSLMTEQLAQAGVNQWRVQNKAMKELMKEEIWFESTCVVLGKGIVKSAAWGLMARVIIGAVVSLTDLVTDFIEKSAALLNDDVNAWRSGVDKRNLGDCTRSGEWYPIKGKVEQWVSSGWAQWEEERPEWFSDIWKESVLEEMRPLKRRSSSLSKRSLKEKLGEEHKESLRQGDAGAGSRGGGGGGGGGGGDGAKVYPAGGERGEGNEEIDIEEFQRELMKMNF